MSKPKICLLGDMVRHVFLKPAPKGEKDKDNNKDIYKAFTQRTGAPIIRRMIFEALGNKNKDFEFSDIIPCYVFKKDNIWGPQLINILKYYPRTSRTKKDDDNVLRARGGAKYFASELVDSEYDCDQSFQPEVGKENSLNLREFLLSDDSSAFIKSDNHNILVIYDRSSDLRKCIKEADEEIKKKLYSLTAAATGGVVIAIRNNINDEDWLKNLEGTLFPSDQSQRERCIVMITADALRVSGFNITEYGSIEQNIAEVVACLGHDPIKRIIEKICAHLVVVFRETAVIYIHKPSSTDKGNGSIHFCPNFDRIAQTNPPKFGVMPGKFTIILTAIVKELYEFSFNIEMPKSDNWNIEAALRFGVAAYNLYFNEGFCGTNESNPKSPFDALKMAASLPQYEKLKDSTWDEKRRDYYLSSLDFDFTLTESGYKPVIEGNPWRRVDALFYKNKRESPDHHWEETDDNSKLFDIVEKGLEKVSRRSKPPAGDEFRSAKIICPYTEIGKIKMIDAQEINGFINLRKLIDKYLASREWSTPLPIAVFGRPGSGKSFSVKEIINSVDPGRKTDPLTFNLAQFSDVDQLTEAFHQVQDRALASDEVPLVIFDEFDSSFGKGPLGWLKFFLAPMQDGLFRGKTGDYRVGRAIFLFSGGTSYTFQDFDSYTFQDFDSTGKKFDITSEKEIQDSSAMRRAVKLDDFIGRLRGYLNVLGINPEDDQSPRSLFKLRRAILLRAQLEKLAEPIFRDEKEGRVANISTEVIKAFLETNKYKYGVRSMEAVIQMSRWIDGRFVVASLPSLLQLEIHVDPESFKNILHDQSSY